MYLSICLAVCIFSNGAYLLITTGTITANSADVWSYASDEDTLVIDPLLPQHLSHWGIDIMKLSKTDKSMTEMEVALNMKVATVGLCDIEFFLFLVTITMMFSRFFSLSFSISFSLYIYISFGLSLTLSRALSLPLLLALSFFASHSHLSSMTGVAFSNQEKISR